MTIQQEILDALADGTEKTLADIYPLVPSVADEKQLASNIGHLRRAGAVLGTRNTEGEPWRYVRPTDTPATKALQAEKIPGFLRANGGCHKKDGVVVVSTFGPPPVSEPTAIVDPVLITGMDGSDLQLAYRNDGSLVLSRPGSAEFSITQNDIAGLLEFMRKCRLVVG